MRKISFVFFLCTLVFAPLAFGTVEQWSLMTVEILIGLAVLLYWLQMKGELSGILSTPGLTPLLLLVGWMVIQILPLPALIVKILSPQSFEIHHLVSSLSNGNSWMPLTVYQKGTLLECLRILAYVLFYVLTVQLLCRGDRLQLTVKICVWLGIGIALLTIMQKFSSPGKIYWFRPGPSNSSPVGPWIYRSQYCGYIEMIVPIALALFLYYRPTIAHDESLRMRIVAIFSRIGSNFSILLGIGAMVMIASAFISLSRGGIIAITGSLLFFFIILALKKARYSRLFYLSIIACCIFFIAWFGWQPIIERFASTVTNTGKLGIDRIPIWQDSFEVFKNFWLTGSGFGTFINIFPQYKTIPGNLIYDHAHCDYLELLTDGGVVGFGLAAWFVIAVIREGWKKMGRRRDRYSILVSIGALTGIIAMLIHSISDFNMHNGADGLYFFFLCGLLVSAGNTRLHYHGEATLLKTVSWPSKKYVLSAASIFLVAVLLLQGGSMLARIQYQQVRGIYLSRQLAPKYLKEISSAARQSARLDPLDGRYPFWQGEVARYEGQRNKALGYYLQAAQKDPLEGIFLQRIALMLPKDRQQYAEKLMEKGTERTLDKDDLILSQAEWLLEIGKREKAIKVLKSALIRNSKLIPVVIPMLQRFAFSRDEVAAVLPESVESWLRYGSYLEESGHVKDAEYYYGHAIDFLHNETKVRAGWFSRLYSFYRKKKQNEKAVAILRIAIEKIPDDAQFHIWLGDYYADKDISYRAIEEYQQALLLQPKNTILMKKIEQLKTSQGQ